MKKKAPDDTLPPEEVAPLTDPEIQNIRTLIEQDQRVRWFWTTIKTWSLAIVAIVAAGAMCVDLFLKAVQRSAGS